MSAAVVQVKSALHCSPQAKSQWLVYNDALTAELWMPQSLTVASMPLESRTMFRDEPLGWTLRHGLDPVVSALRTDCSMLALNPSMTQSKQFPMLPNQTGNDFILDRACAGL